MLPEKVTYTTLKYHDRQANIETDSSRLVTLVAAPLTASSSFEPC